MADRTETGKDGVLIVSGREVPFSSVSVDISFDTSEVTANDALNNKQAYTSKSAELTVEADGSKTELKGLLLNGDGTPKEGLSAEIQGSEGGSRFTEGRVLAALPEGFLDPTAIPDSLDRDELAELSDEELIKEIENAGGDVGELMSGQLLDAEATEVVIGAMVDSFSHPELADTELRNMLESSQFPDSGFNQMLNKMIEVSTPSEGVRDFRGSS